MTGGINIQPAVWVIWLPACPPQLQTNQGNRINFQTHPTIELVRSIIAYPTLHPIIILSYSIPILVGPTPIKSPLHPIYVPRNNLIRSRTCSDEIHMKSPKTPMQISQNPGSAHRRGSLSQASETQWSTE
jgi:hypothetical protein